MKKNWKSAFLAKMIHESEIFVKSNQQNIYGTTFFLSLIPLNIF